MRPPLYTRIFVYWKSGTTPVPGVVAEARSLIAQRRDRARLSLIAVPLAMTAATASLQLWLLPPLVFLGWYWGSKEESWLWLLGIQEACFTVVWVFLGAATLAALPQYRLLVGIGWIGYAGLMLMAGSVNRWRFHRKYGY